MRTIKSEYTPTNTTTEADSLVPNSHPRAPIALKTENTIKDMHRIPERLTYKLLVMTKRMINIIARLKKTP